LPNNWKGYEESDENYFDNREETNNQEIDFDKDIDEILKEIENDPELKIDEDEIEKILKEIEEESNEEDGVEIDLD
jgi:CBS-domain-containing membrane protein